MLIGIAFIFLLILLAPVLKMIVKITNKEGARAVENTAKGLSNASDALPTMGASFAASSIADSMGEVPVLKSALGINDDKIVTMTQLHNYMREHDMM